MWTYYASRGELPVSRIDRLHRRRVAAFVRVVQGRQAPVRRFD